ncbi:MAG TPA: T9SS type A sorting domain-containing protein [Candidatus Krumholzibacteria bacterium]|nr:T9SS type A sorting domain-containing protein [Candidatus Krumholzibacteria bacterium]
MKARNQLSCFVLLAVLGTAAWVAPARSTQVFSTDFESGVPAEFSAPGSVIAGVQGYGGLGPLGNQFGGSFLRYTAVPIMDTKLTLHNLPAHDHVSISFLLALIDSWDGTELLRISVDGVEVFSNWFQLATGDASSYVAPPGGLLSSGVELGFSLGSWYARDRAYDMSVDPVFNDIPHTADSLTVAWYLGAVSGSAAQNWQGGTDESWAIDNVRVDVSSVTTGIGDTPAPAALTLGPNSPNPFQTFTMLRVASPRNDNAELDVFDVRGRRVRHDVVPLRAGWQDIAITGVDDRGQALASGVYFYRVRTAGETRTRKMVIMR